MSATAEEVEARAPAEYYPYKEPDPRWPHLVLPQIATLEETQQSTDLFFQEHSDAKVIAIDMRGVSNVSILTLADILSLMNSRKRDDKETIILPPDFKNEDARDVLNQWEFPRAIWDSVGTIFEHFDIGGRDHAFFQEREGALVRMPAFTEGPFAGEQSKAFRKLTHKFFSFHRVRAKEIPGEINYWINLMEEILLTDRLTASEKNFGKYIVYEALMNTLVVRRGRGIEVASRFSDPGNLERNFTWLSWDQGESIIAKIKRSKAKEFLRVDPENPTSYFVTTKDFKGNIMQRFSEGSSVAQLSKLSDYDALVQWLSLHRLSRNVHEPSLGMYMLVNAACDIYGGEVVVRTGKYRMNIQRRPEDLKLPNEIAYDITITKSAPNTPSFVGNMIAVRLPLKPQ